MLIRPKIEIPVKTSSGDTGIIDTICTDDDTCSLKLLNKYNHEYYIKVPRKKVKLKGLPDNQETESSDGNGDMKIEPGKRCVITEGFCKNSTGKICGKICVNTTLMFYIVYTYPGNHFVLKKKEELSTEMIELPVATVKTALEMLRYELQKQNPDVDWKGIDDMLFANLTFTKDELKQIYNKDTDFIFIGSAIEE